MLFVKIDQKMTILLTCEHDFKKHKKSHEQKDEILYDF